MHTVRPSITPSIAAEASEFMQSSSATILEVWPEVNYFSFALLAPPTIKMIIRVLSKPQLANS